MSKSGSIAAQLRQPQPPAPVGLGPVVRDRHRDRDFVLRRALLIADILALWLALTTALVIVGDRSAAASLWILPTLPVWAFLFRTYMLYRRPIRRFEPGHLDDFWTLFHALILGTLALWLFYKLAPVSQLNLAETVTFGLLALSLIALMRVIVRRVNRRIQGPEEVFVVAPINEAKALLRKLHNHPEYHMQVVGAVKEQGVTEELDLPLTTDLAGVGSLLDSRKIDHLVVELDNSYLPQESLVELMRASFRAGVRFSAFPRATNLLLPGSEVNHIEGMGFISSPLPVFSRTSRLMKRSMDIVISGVALVVLAPLMAAIAVAIAFDSSGAVFFSQVRVGRGGKRFRLLKFRTMVENANEMTAQLMKKSLDPDWLLVDDDPRITTVGRFLRKTSLDELPQLSNILKGDMSLVGPRPLSECDDEKVCGWERHRLDLMPGLTGPWQVLGRTSIPFREMIELDYAYVASWSLLYDFKLLLRTVPAVLQRRGVN